MGACAPAKQGELDEDNNQLALAAVVAVELLGTGIGTAQAAKHKHHLLACPGKPGTVKALLCPAK
jgi:hypothetical protein